MSLASYDLTRLLRPVARQVEERMPRLWTHLRGVNYDLRLLLGGKLLLFAVVDLLMVFSAFFRVTLDGAGVDLVYLRVVVIPSLVIGVPALSGVLALERRAGSLDLALAVPSTVRYFVRRASSVLVCLAAQSVILLTLAWFEESGGITAALSNPGVYFRAITQTALVLALLTATVLFWSVRIRSGGGVMVASAATLLLMGRWIFSPPDAVASNTERFMGLPIWHFRWLVDVSVLLVAVLICGLYARERLRRPETLL